MHSSYRKAIVLLGAILNAFPLSLLSYYGNILPYIASYFHANQNEISVFVDPLWTTSSFVCAYTIAMIFTSPMELRFGIRPCLITCNLVLWIAVMSGFYTVKEPLALTLVFGGVQGIAVGSLYTLTLKLLLLAMPKQEGTATGIMTIGPVFGALVNIGVAYAVINPNNKKPDLYENNRTYFSDKGLIDAVPLYFFVTGAVTVASTLIGTILMFIGSAGIPALKRPEKASSKTEKLDKETNSISKSDSADKSQETDVISELEPADKSESLPIITNLIETSDKKPGLLITEDQCKLCKNYMSVTNEETDLTEDGQRKKSPQVTENNNTQLIPVDLSPRETVKTVIFWCLWIAFMVSNHTTYLQLNLYKQYGQQGIADDHLLVTTGIIANAGMMVIRPLVGVASDRFGIRNTAIALNASSCLFMCLMVLSLHRFPLLYAILVVVENVFVSPQTLLFSILAAVEFGNTHCASNMGLICSGNIVLILLEPYIVEATIATLGWDMLFLSGSGSAILATLAIMAMNWFSWCSRK